MAVQERPSHWLDQYANNFHRWRTTHHNGRELFYRPLGLVEHAFDVDGRYYEGRADLNVALTLDIRSQLTNAQLRTRILLAWTTLRLRHVLLSARAVSGQKYMVRGARNTSDRHFVVTVPKNSEEAVEEAGRSLVFLEDHYDRVDGDQFYHHVQNCARVLPNGEMARLFLLPVEQGTGERATVRLVFVLGHQITDGLSNQALVVLFAKILNTKKMDLEAALPVLMESISLQQRLPLPQEDLYPPVKGSRARRRWFWLLTLVLRHVRRPLPAAFPNPLRRTIPLVAAQAPDTTFDAVLDYSRTPPLRTSSVSACLSTAATARLHRLCREAKSSIGAGCFVLVAIVMMELHEVQQPTITPSARHPFIAGFPVNPRPFLVHPAPAANSLMLAFSDGVVLPFLPSTLALDARIRLLVRSAHRQLAQFQKRPRLADSSDARAAALAHMGSRGAGRVLATSYISAVERAERILPERLRAGRSPQGQLSVQPNGSLQTCGVSSMGRYSAALEPGQWDLDAAEVGGGEDAFVADMRALKQNVRAREGEFLVGIGGDGVCVSANVSFDASAIDEGMAGVWKEKMERLLEKQDKAKL